jgi:hypothetical protein
MVCGEGGRRGRRGVLWFAVRYSTTKSRDPGCETTSRLPASKRARRVGEAGGAMRRSQRLTMRGRRGSLRKGCGRRGAGEWYMYTGDGLSWGEAPNSTSAASDTLSRLAGASYQLGCDDTAHNSRGRRNIWTIDCCRGRRYRCPSDRVPVCRVVVSIYLFLRVSHRQRLHSDWAGGSATPCCTLSRACIRAGYPVR